MILVSRVESRSNKHNIQWVASIYRNHEFPMRGIIIKVVHTKVHGNNVFRFTSGIISQTKQKILLARLRSFSEIIIYK